MTDPVEVPNESTWWKALQRDGERCRVAPFLPDMPCTGSLDIYSPVDLDDDDPDLDDAVTACDGHKAWIATHSGEARELGLVRPSAIRGDTAHGG